MAQTRDHVEPKSGDLIEISRGTYSHWAIYVRDDYVIHLAPPNEEACGGFNSMPPLDDKAIVKMDRLCHVVGTSKFSINNLLDDKYEPRSVGEILKDARSLVGQELPCCVFRGNCEHFVTDLRYGKPESRQVCVAIRVAEELLSAIGVSLLAAAAVVAFKSVMNLMGNSQ